MYICMYISVYQKRVLWKSVALKLCLAIKVKLKQLNMPHNVVAYQDLELQIRKLVQGQFNTNSSLCKDMSVIGCWLTLSFPLSLSLLCTVTIEQTQIQLFKICLSKETYVHRYVGFTYTIHIRHFTYDSALALPESLVIITLATLTGNGDWDNT